MIGRGSGAGRKSGPPGGRRRRSTANSASGRIRTRRKRPRAKRPCPAGRDMRPACRSGQASASERRDSTDARACAGLRRPVGRSMRVDLVGRSRPSSAVRLVPGRLTRTRPCEARTCERRTSIGSDWPVTKAQLGVCAATRGSVKTWVTGSTPSVSATGAAAPGSTVGTASTSAGAGGSGTTGTSVAALVLDAADSIAGAGAGASSGGPGTAFGSSSAGIPAVGSSS
jgi:hypothetical protein